MTDTNIRNAAALGRFSSEHPSWVLEMCRGVRGHTWWWMRNRPDGQETVRVHGTAARTAIKRGVFKRDVTWTDWRSVIYRRQA